MLHLYFGADLFRRNSGLKAYLKSLGDPDMLALNTVRVDGRRVGLDEIFMHSDTIPFMADHRLILVDGLAEQFERKKRGTPASEANGGGRTKDNAIAGRLVDYASRMPATSEIVFLEGALGKSNPIVKALQECGDVEFFPALEGAALVAWIQNTLSEIGGEIEPAALKALTETGSDTYALWNDLQKLAAYAIGRAIRADDVTLLVSGHRQEANIFRIIDATVGGKPQTALSELNALMADGSSHPLVVLTMLSRHYRLLLLILAYRARKTPPAEIQRHLGVRSDWAFRKNSGQAGRFQPVELEKQLTAISATELSIKTGEIEANLGVSLLVAELSGA